MDYQKTTLKNGLRVITVPMLQMDSVTVVVGVGAGSRYETKRVNGLFHFLEHMAFKGTKKRPSTLQIATEVDSVGGEFNAFTSKEITSYCIKLAAKHTELAFDVLADILTNSLFRQEEIERERGVIIEEINLYEDTPTRRVLDLFESLLYGDNPMGWDIAGKKENIRQIKRGDFLKYVNRLYFPQNMTVVVAGKLDKSKITKLAEQYFGKLKRTGKNQTKKIKLNQKKSKVQLIYKKTEQAHFCLGVPGYCYSHPDRFAIGILATILGGGMSSRLFIEIRERRGLAYYVGCSPEFFADSGYLLARAGVRLDSTDGAIKVILEEYDKLRNNEITKLRNEELKKAKEFLKGRLILALEDSQMVAERYTAQILLEKKIRDLKETMREIDKVTTDDVVKVAKDIFRPEKLNLAIIGPFKNRQRFEKLLRL